MEQSIRRLPDAELEVMQALWSCTIPATSREIEAALPAGRTMAQTTVLTLLSRLADRGMVTVEKAGRRSLYTPRRFPGAVHGGPEPDLVPEALRRQRTGLCRGPLRQRSHPGGAANPPGSAGA